MNDPFSGLSPENRAILERQAQTLEAEARAQVAANAEVLPGPLREAFAGIPEEVAGLRVRRLVHWDFVILRRMESPLLDQLSGNASSTKPYTDDQGAEMVWQFTRPCEEVDALIEKLGVAGARSAAKREIGMKLGPLEVGLLVKSVEREFVRAFSTAVKYGRKPGESGGAGETVFTGPATTPALKTDSAGGSTTSAA